MNKLSEQSTFKNLFAWEFMEMISEAFFVFDYSLHFIFVNKKATQVIGKSKKELLGRTVSEVFPEVKEKSIYIDYIKSKKILSKKPLEYYSPSMNKWLSVKVCPTKLGIAVCARDITDLKKAQEVAKESQDVLNAFFENSPISLVIYDEEMRLLKIDNYTARTFFGKQSKDIIGKSLKVLTPKYAEKITVLFQEVLKKNESIITEFSIPQEGKSEFHGLSSRFPLQFANGKKGVGTITLDITERFQNEKRKDDFIAIASHELKTPLTSAKIFTQVLQKRFEGLGDGTSLQLLKKVDGKIDQLETLIKVLLDASLTDRRKISQKKEKFIFKELALHTIADMQLSIKHKLITDWQTNEYLFADKDRVAQVLINIIANAAKYSDDSKKIIIRSRKDGEQIVISVQDFGVGISKDDQANIFKRFYQANDNKTYPGLGLGLYIAKEIITENGGQVWVDSIKGRGSTFYFSLPIYKRNTKNKNTQRSYVTE